mgnify:CR=1 FL=1
MKIIELTAELSDDYRNALLDDIAAIDKNVFKDSSWGREAFKENVINDYDCLLAAVTEDAKMPGTENADGSKPDLLNAASGTALDSCGEEKNVAIGYALLRCFDDAELIFIAVSDGYRGRGIGGRLLGRLISEAEIRRVGSIFLEVRAGNTPALKMYENAGFKAEGIRKGYYHDPKEDAVIMRFEC